jgi:hypothetical protein
MTWLNWPQQARLGKEPRGKYGERAKSYILKSIEQSKAIEQKRLEADISRQSKVIDAQAKFLDDTTEVLWNWRYLSMKVGFNGSEEREEQYATSVTEYEAGIWDSLSALRNQASKSRRLVSEKGYEHLVALYRDIVKLDGELDQILRQKLPPKERAAALRPIHETLYAEMTQRLDDTLAVLAEEVQLSTAQSERHAR